MPTNVLRFPAERRARPTLELMRVLAPDVGDVLAVTDISGGDPWWLTLRDQADADATGYIAMHDGIHMVMPADGLDKLLDAAVTMAVAACWSSRDALAATYAARRARQAARAGGQERIRWLQAQIDKLLPREVDLLIQAHARVEEAEGVARAVDVARRAEAWTRQAHQNDGGGVMAWAAARLMRPANTPPSLRVRSRSAAALASFAPPAKPSNSNDDGPCAA